VRDGLPHPGSWAAIGARGIVVRVRWQPHVRWISPRPRPLSPLCVRMSAQRNSGPSRRPTGRPSPGKKVSDVGKTPRKAAGKTPRKAAANAPAVEAGREGKRRRAEAAPGTAEPQRLQKVLAAAGVGSRRLCEQLILDGRVEVDRQVVTELGTRVDPHSQEVRVDGTVLRRPRRVYLALNKPSGVLSTNSDPQGRTRVIDLIGTEERLFSVGRLDRGSEGLMLVTNDGELAFRLTHPSFGVPKTYFVQVAGSPQPEQLQMLKQGVRLAEGIAKVASFKVRSRRKTATELEIVLTEGRNREIRRLLARVGHKVLKLRRIAIGPLRLGQLAVGESRRLTADEVRLLRRVTADPGSATGKKTDKKAGKATKGRAPTSNTKAPAGKTRGARSSGSGRPASPLPKLNARPLPATVLDYDTPETSPGGEGQQAGQQAGQQGKHQDGAHAPRTGAPRTARPRARQPRKAGGVRRGGGRKSPRQQTRGAQRGPRGRAKGR
jgi:23S rRNA pseudouridine2605 synthase